MDERRWERWAAASGILFVAATLVGTFLPGTPPKPDDPISKIQSFFADHRTKELTGLILAGVGILALIWFLGVLRTVLRRGEGGAGRLSALAFGGGLVVAAVAIVSGSATLTLTYRIATSPDATPGLVRALFDFGNLCGTLIGFPAAALLGAASLVILRTGVLNKGLGWLGMLAAVANLAAMSQLYYKAGSWAPGGSASFIPFLLAALWTLVASIAMMIKLGKPEMSPS